MQKVQPEEGASADIVSDNIERLKELFPDAFTEGAKGNRTINFDVLRQLLGDVSVLDEGEEKYGLNWHGKKKARQIALTPSTGTLLPCPEQSVDWDTTKNLFIEGDNLEVLKLLQKSYANKVKMIYIDPPYNTGKEFIYPDKFQENLDTYLKYTGQVDDEGMKFSSNTETTGRRHTNWLNMMYPRLKLARHLLTNDGVIAIHIDEHEFSNLTVLLDDIFGAENNFGPIIWDKKNPKGDAKKIATQHEYLVLYAKNFEILKEISPIKRSKANAKLMLERAKYLFGKDEDLDQINKIYKKWLNKQSVSGGEAAYKYIDEDGHVYRNVSMAWPNKQQAPDDYLIPLKHPITGMDCPIPERGWRNPSKTMNELLNKNLILFGANEIKQPERKYFLHENMEENIPSIIPYAGSDDALLKDLGVTFDNPKPVNFVQDILHYFLMNNDTVIDFFAGSGTTAHALMNQNTEDGANRRFIMIQLPEKVAEGTTASAAGFETISELGMKRIKLAADKIKAENPETDCDFGYKLFKLSGSNIQNWNPDRTDLEKTLLSHQEHLIEGRTEQDVLYELLLKRGVDLAVPIEEREVSGKTIYSIGYGVLFACLDASITKKQVEAIGQGIVEWFRELAPQNNGLADTHVFFRDSAFRDDISKTNMAAILEQNGITHVRSL